MDDIHLFNQSTTNATMGPYQDDDGQEIEVVEPLTNVAKVLLRLDLHVFERARHRRQFDRRLHRHLLSSNAFADQLAHSELGSRRSHDLHLLFAAQLLVHADHSGPALDTRRAVVSHSALLTGDSRIPQLVDAGRHQLRPFRRHHVSVEAGFACDKREGSGTDMSDVVLLGGNGSTVCPRQHDHDQRLRCPHVH